MSTLLPTDANNFPIPALRLRTGASHTIAVTATSARNSVAFNAATAVVTDHYIPAETVIDIAVAGDDEQTASYVAAIRLASNGTLYVSEKF
jgi:predicted dinucleotide-binding enzyme